MAIYQVIETPHDGQGSAKSIAEFATHHQAMIHSSKSMKEHLIELTEPGLSALELFEKWRKTGRGYRIQPADVKPAFSDVDYARLFVLRLADDYSHPVYLEVSTVDCLRTASGINSPEKTWKFWVKAPATYAGDGLDDLMYAGTANLYDNMSQQSMSADGSTYVLVSMKFRQVSEAEVQVAMNADPSATLYYVQNDGSFSKRMPVNPLAKTM